MKNFVWNEEKVFIGENSKNGTYEFNNFNGFICFGSNNCTVKNADFIVNIRHIEYLTGKHIPVKPWDVNVNEIIWNNGEVISGNFNPHHWKNGIFNGDENGMFNGKAKMFNVLKEGIVKKGNVQCVTWERGTFKGEQFNGTFNCGVFKSSNGIFYGTWLDGHFHSGIFKGKWKGGKWLNITTQSFQGESYVGDGTFDSVVKE